jgi:hypothetical protein
MVISEGAADYQACGNAVGRWTHREQSPILLTSQASKQAGHVKAKRKGRDFVEVLWSRGEHSTGFGERDPAGRGNAGQRPRRDEDGLPAPGSPRAA